MLCVIVSATDNVAGRDTVRGPLFPSTAARQQQGVFDQPEADIMLDDVSDLEGT